MSDHADCRRAIIESRRPSERTWHCVDCRRLLATTNVAAAGVEPVDDVRRLPGDHLGIPRFGKSQRELRGRLPRSDGGVAPTRRLPIYVYCPRVGCGLGQHVDY